MRTSLKKWIRATSTFSALISSRLIRTNVGNFLELNSTGQYQSSGKQKESCCVVFPSSTKREIRHFHVAPATTAKKCIQKSVMHVQSCCFANINLLLFFLFSLPSPSSLLKLPNEHDHGLDTMRKPCFAHEKQKGWQQNLVISIQSFSKVPGHSWQTSSRYLISNW